MAAAAEAPIDPWECVFSPGPANKAVSVDVTELDFGACTRLRAVEPKLVFPGLGAVGVEGTYVVRDAGPERRV